MGMNDGMQVPSATTQAYKLTRGDMMAQKVRVQTALVGAAALHWDAAEAPAFPAQLLQERFVPLATDGDGACAIHSVWGKPTQTRTLRFEGARALVATLLSPLKHTSARRALQNQACIRNVEEALWHELAQPVAEALAASVRGAPALEAGFFGDALQDEGDAGRHQEHIMPELALAIRVLTSPLTIPLG